MRLLVGRFGSRAGVRISRRSISDIQVLWSGKTTWLMLL